MRSFVVYKIIFDCLYLDIRTLSGYFGTDPLCT
jgi:hypothetical protein